MYRQERAILLRDQAWVTMGSMRLEAAVIRIDMEQELLTAYGVFDSTGTITERPVFQEGDQKFAADTIRYHFGTRRGWVYSGSTAHSEGNLRGNQIKMITDSSYFLGNAKFTTCNHAYPHFAIVTPQAKMDVGKRIVTGPAYLQLLDIPTPLALPFGFFPMMEERGSGFILPNFQDRNLWGLGLTGFGHYWALNDHWDMRLTGDIYTRGSWGIHSQAGYRYRYRYSGNFNMDVTRTRFGDDRNPNTGQTMNSLDYRIRWSHRQDAKAHPSRTFSASVNMASGTFFKNTSTDPNQFLASDLSSSISYNKRFTGTPFTMTAAASHRQSNQNGTMTVNLPSLNISMNRIYPFRNPNRAGAGRWYEDIGLTYRMNASNQVSDDIEAFVDPATYMDAQNMKLGVDHSMRMGTNAKVLRYLTFNPSVSYRERWYPYALDYAWDAASQSVNKDTLMGWVGARDFQGAAALSTTLYGMFNFKRGPVKAVRHVLNPSVSANYRPDFTDPLWNAYQEVQSDTSGATTLYSRYQGFLYGAPPTGAVGGASFRLSQNLEGKWLAPGDSGDPEKFKILDDLTMTTMYNAIASTHHWTPVALRASSSLAKGKLRINYQGVYDWYGQDSVGTRLTTFAREMNQGVLRPTLHNFSANLRLRGGGKASQLIRRMNDQGFELDAYDDYYAVLPYADWSAPWTLNLGYNLRIQPKAASDVMDVTQSLRIDGTWNPTPNWRIGVKSGYDFEAQDFTYTTFDVTRQLHCWYMTMRWVPSGYARSFYFSIGVKASLLKDLNYDMRRGIGDF